MLKKYILLLTAVLIVFTACNNKKNEILSMDPDKDVHPPRFLHPSFNLTDEDLKEICSELPESVQINIKEKSQYFLQLILDIHPWDSDLTVLVNKDQGLGADDIPNDLISLDDFKSVLLLSRRGHHLRAVILPSLFAMVEHARQEDIELMISSTYRSYEYQEGLYNRYVEKDGQEAADRYSARPGKSQHQLGTVVDFGSIDDSFALTSAGKWIKNNAWRYGFSLSYPEGMEAYTGYIWESWHYRYIGEDAAKMEMEFFEGIQERMLRFLNTKSSLFEAALI